MQTGSDCVGSLVSRISRSKRALIAMRRDSARTRECFQVYHACMCGCVRHCQLESLRVDK